MGTGGGVSLRFGQKEHCISTVALGICRGDSSEDTCMESPLSSMSRKRSVWVRKDPSSVSVSTCKREMAFPFSLSCWGPMDNQPLCFAEMAGIHGRAFAALASNLFMWNRK